MINSGTSLYVGQNVVKFLGFVIIGSAQGNVQSLPICVGQLMEDSRKYRGKGSARLHQGTDGDRLDPALRFRRREVPAFVFG